MGIFLVLIAACFLPLTNLSMRRCVDVRGSAKAYFVFQMATSLVLAILLNPVRTGDYAFNGAIAGLGIVAGLILSLMLFFLGKAIEKGPPGLTFAILNSATVMPGLLMALIFGASLGFAYNGWHAAGSLFVLGGLFWAGNRMGEMREKRKWVLFSASTFSFHILLLCLFQWRAMLHNLPNPQELVSFFTAEQIKSQWFIPFMFLSCGMVQLAIYLGSERKRPEIREIGYGVLGGITNMLCTFFLIWSTEVASPLENAIIFPIYSVVSIILTNAWGQRLYQEQVNWKACQICAFGLFIGTVDWPTLAAAIGF